MTLRIMSIFCAISLFMLLWQPVQAADLRGFGTIQASALPAGQGMKFVCDSPAHATLIIHKLARDMALSATVPSHWTTVQIAGQAVPVLVRPGLGAYLVLTQGSDAYCFTAPLATGQNESGLAAAFAPAALLLPGAKLYDAAFTYPVYLDKWSTRGIGTWYSPYAPFGDDPPGLKSIVDAHFQYMKANNLTVHFTDYGPDRREADHFLTKYQRPYHTARWHEWDADFERLNPYDLIQPGNVFTQYTDYYGELSFGGDKLQQYRDWKFQDYLKQYVNDPLLVDWDEPHAEIGPSQFEERWDYGEENRAHFAKFLQTEKHYTLASLGQAWHHDSGYFKSWNKVPIPYDYALFGFDRNSLFADRTWRLHIAEIVPGLTAGYAHSEFNDAKWPSFQLPGGQIGMLAAQAHKHFWYRGTITVPASYLAAHTGPLYLDIATLTEAAYKTNPDHIWFNDKDLGVISGQPGTPLLGSKDVSGLVHAGVNHIVYSPASDYIPGGFFLATKPMENYPYTDSDLNARYVDWHDYIANSVLEEERHTIQTIRGTDPDRFIKVMAVQPKDLFSPMMAAYGCFTHNTGDEAFFYPWDKRLAYPYGYTADAESSASMLDPASWKRWFGWFTFSGLNGFDNFIDVESMMYAPSVTPLWQENFPYLHLANRYDMKKPEIGLLWSGPNNRLGLGGNYSLAFCWDLGRGDIQPLGYSYAYFDEPGLHRHLADGYKVLWDCGTYVMSKETVADIRHFVEQGGTYVALAETGRNTLTEKDAWPIESLSGFHVKEVRPLGGFVSILNDQPLFTTLAGQNFENYGRSIDYSNFNYADKCTALEAVAPDTQAIARYRDGTIAIGMRTLGKGRVVVLGSPFWRDSYDQAGVWHPSAAQEVFLQDLLTGLGVPPDVPSAVPSPVWRDRYVANNGTEEYLLLFNPGATDTQSVTADWHMSFPAAQVFDPKTGQQFPATITGSTAQVSVILAPYETKILAVQSPRPATETVSVWYNNLATRWQGTSPGHKAVRPDLPFYTVDFPAGAGKIVDTASVTPARLASLSSSSDAEDGWDTHLDFVRPKYLEIATTPTQSVLYRRVVTVPASWKPGDKYLLRMKIFQDFSGIVYLNGQQVATAQQVYSAGDEGIDVASAIRFPGPNVLVVASNQNGDAANPDLWRQPAPVSTLSLAGDWTIKPDEDHTTTLSRLPGAFTGLLATKIIVVPASWSKSHVFLRISWEKGAAGHLAVNDKTFAGGWDNIMPKYMDVTPWIKFGLPNRILIQPNNSTHSWQPDTMTIKSAQLEQVLHL